MSRGPGSLERGRHWEAFAAEYLAVRGVRILAQGYRCRMGEIDIVGSDATHLLIIEVRARRSSRFGSAPETVNHAKQQRIIRATRHYLMRNPGAMRLPLRFDVFAIDHIEAAEPEVRWIRNAFDAA